MNFPNNSAIGLMIGYENETSFCRLVDGDGRDAKNAQ
jgi:hypothetical protein